MSYRFQKLLESATEQTLVEPNWEGILDCVDMIRGAEVPVKDALLTIQKRFHNNNPHVAHHALLVLEACVKNCGKKFIAEVATKDFMEDLKNLLISNPQENVRNKILELIQCWASAFKGISEYKIVSDTHSLLKMNGFEFPPIDEAKAMFLAESAPDWAEDDNCYRCRVEFGVFTRKHHCRACGQIFCDKCSNKQMLLPQFGIEKKVRVCEACFEKKEAQMLAQSQMKITVDNEGNEANADRERKQKEAEAKEQEELELALAISQSEAEAREQQLQHGFYKHGINDNNLSTSNGGMQQKYPFYNIQKNTELIPSTINNSREEFTLSGMADDTQDQPFDSVLAKYLDRDYWERKRRETEEQALRATAPPPSEISVSVSSSISHQHPANLNGITNKTPLTAMIPPITTSANVYATTNDSLNFSQLEHEVQQQGQQMKQQQMDEIARNYAKINLIGVDKKATIGNNIEGEEDIAETSQFCHALKERVETMNNRMRSNQLRGRSIINDSAIHSLFAQLTDFHAAVIQRMTKLEEQREHYERLQDHLAHIQESRQAINALREESERQRQELLKEEQSRRQIQLRQKLEMMRHKKHEMLLSERCAAIQRFQEQERQIRQRMVQPQSPLTVGAAAVVVGNSPMMPMPISQQSDVSTPMTATTIGETAKENISVPPLQQQNQPLLTQQPISAEYSSMFSQSHMAAPQMTYQATVPAPMIYHYSSLNSQRPTFIDSPQMMYGGSTYLQHPVMPPHLIPPSIPTQSHPQPFPLIASYQQYMPPLPVIPNAQQVQSQQQQIQETPKAESTTNVPEDLLISFD